MATAEEGGVTAITIPSPYGGGGGGAGGKFRRKTFRRQATPYDRPPIVLRGNNYEPGGWLTKVFVDPARKFISHGMERFFATVFRKRLPAPAPQRQPEVNNSVSDANQQENLNDDRAPENHVVGECSHLDNGSAGHRISELEQLLKQNTFTRPEIVRLTELLHSKAAEASRDDTVKERLEAALDFRQHGQVSSSTGKNIKEEIRFSTFKSTPVHQSQVPDDDNSSPAEIAKAYMGARAYKASPSALGGPQYREDKGFPKNGSFASKSPAILSTKKNSVNFSTTENGYATPNFGGRSAIYNLARTPYSRDNSIFKASTKFHDRLPTSPSTLVENGEIYASQSANLKRRASVIDDEIGSIGPVRRIRQKSNLVASRSPFGGRVGLQAKQKFESGDEPSVKDSRNAMENGNHKSPSTSYAHVPPRSSEVAAKILQQLEQLSPKERSSQFQLTTAMLSRKALRSMESVGSPILPPEMQNDKKLEEMEVKSLPDSHDSLQKPENEGTGLTDYDFPSQTWKSNGNNDVSPNSNGDLLRTKTADSSVGDGAYEPSHKKRAFRISAQEDFLELDDDAPGPSSRSFIEKPEIVEPSTTLSKFLLPKETNLVKTEIQPDVTLPSSLDTSKAFAFSGSSVSVTGEKSSVTLPALGGGVASSHSDAATLSAERSKEADRPTQASIFTSKVEYTFPSLSSYSPKEAASELENTSSLTATLPLPVKKKLEVEKTSHLGPAKAGEANGKSEIIPLAANKSLFSVPLPPSFGAASSGGITQNSKGSGFLISSSTSAASNVSSGVSTPVGGSIFVQAIKSSSSVGHLPLSVSAESTKAVSETSGYSLKTDIQNIFGGSSESQPAITAVGAEKSAIPTFGLGSSFSQSTDTDLVGPTFGDPSKNPVSGAGTVVNPSHVFAASASISETTAAVPDSSQPSHAAQGDESAAATKGTETSFDLSSSSTSAMGLGSGGNTQNFNFSSSTITGESTSTATPSFSFGVGLSGTTGANAASSVSGGSSSIFGGFGWSSGAPSSAIKTPSSNSVFSSAWQNSNSPVFGAAFTSFVASSTPSAPVNSTASVFSSSTTASSTSPFLFTSAPPLVATTFTSFSASSATPGPVHSAASVFNSSTIASSSPIFSFTTAPASGASPSSLPFSQPVFGKSVVTGFTSSPGNNDQMNAEDSMAEDPVQSCVPAFPVFGQQSAPLSAAASSFGSTAPPQANPFFSFGQQNQVTPQGSGSLDFNASGGGFSMGSGGPDKSRKLVRVSKTRNRRKP